MKVMILAAGLGTRLTPHTLTTPKAAMPFLNIPLAAYGFESIRPLKPKELVVNTFHLPALVEKLFSRQLSAWLPPVHFSKESDFIRGSGGGLKLAEAFFKDEADFILMNADEVFFPEDPEFMVKALEFHRQQKSLSTIITTHHHEVGKKFGGVWTDAHNRIFGFGKEKIEGSQVGQHNVGIQILSSRIFKYLAADRDCNILYDGVTAALADGLQAWAFPTEGVWFETGNQVDFLDATRESLNLLTLPHLPTSQYLGRLLKKYSPQSHFTKSGKNLILAHEMSVWTAAQIHNFAVLGENSSIEKGVSVDSVVLGPHAKVSADFNFGIKLGGG